MNINELAAKHNVSYQAIHNHFKALKNEEPYKNAYHKKGHQTELDDVLVKAIEARMETPERVVLSDSVNEELEAENKRLTEVNQYQKIIIQLQAEKAVLLEQASELLALQASHEDLKQRLQDAEARAYNAEVEAGTQRAAADEAQRRTSEARTRADQAQAEAIEKGEKIVALQTERDMEKKRREEAEAELDNLKSRGFWKRLFNKE